MLKKEHLYVYEFFNLQLSDRLSPESVSSMAAESPSYPSEVQSEKQLKTLGNDTAQQLPQQNGKLPYWKCTKIQPKIDKKKSLNLIRFSKQSRKAFWNMYIG